MCPQVQILYHLHCIINFIQAKSMLLNSAIADMMGALTLNQKSLIKGVILITNLCCRGYLVSLCWNSPSLPSCLSSVLGDEKF